ncbi:PREDICTED: uncharacterized protein LOC109162927 [Ipomoea nil]|uniref:uncharacterized protein LOC109162927 n=1 Tax=Ipomoea nil TaxID=35883 RepID=UPI000900E96E|nr:PREDICTED: uncharacterized protein LOC109162927 [Ipomoea nil]
MRRLGFSEVWIDMVFRGVSNVWYSVIVNGIKEGFFTSSRGLRQGDPLSPTLFVIAAEVLSVYLARGYDDYTVPRFTQPSGTPHIHHLAYANDVIIFCTARLGEITKVISALKDYEEISGQLVSFQNSAFYMDPRTPVRVIDEVRRGTGCAHNDFPFTYLGCPVYIGRKKRIYFASVIDKVKAKCLSWQQRPARRPSKSLWTWNGALQASSGSNLGGPSTIGARGKLSPCLRRRGGVGFLDLDLMVRAASAKLWWNFRTEHTLWSDFMRAKYCRRVHPVAKVARYSDSHTWRRMLAVRDEVEQVQTWRLFQGRVNFWWDNWLGLGPLGKLFPFPRVFYSREMFLDYMHEGALDLTGHEELLYAGVLVDLSRMGQGPRDIPLWTAALDGMFSFSSAKAYLRPILPIVLDPLLAKCWRKHLPFKVSFLAWRVLRGRVPTDDALSRFGHVLVSKCRCCSSPASETITHVALLGDVGAMETP